MTIEQQIRDNASELQEIYRMIERHPEFASFKYKTPKYIKGFTITGIIVISVCAIFLLYFIIEVIREKEAAIQIVATLVLLSVGLIFLIIGLSQKRKKKALAFCEYIDSKNKTF